MYGNCVNILKQFPNVSIKNTLNLKIYAPYISNKQQECKNIFVNPEQYICAERWGDRTVELCQYYNDHQCKWHHQMSDVENGIVRGFSVLWQTRRMKCHAFTC